MKKYTCPFCYSKYSMYDIVDSTTDYSRTSHHTLVRQLLNRNTSAICRCPACGIELPNILFQKPNLRLGILGFDCSGKSSYITAMLHELEQASDLSLKSQYHLLETGINLQEYVDNLFEKHRCLPATSVGVAGPQIWEIQNQSCIKRKTVPHFSCMLSDHAGEDCEMEKQWDDYLQDIKFSDAIILVIDPLTFKNIRNKIDKDVLINSLATDCSKDYLSWLSHLSDFLYVNHGMKKNMKINKPAAIVLTKIDTVIDCAAFSTLKQKSNVFLDGRINVDEIEKINDEIRKWLMESGEGTFVNTIDSLFSDYSFFGISSYGAPPINQCVEEIKPHRTLDPFYWLLYRTGFIK